MKYIDSEKLIAEIEKWEESSPVHISESYEDGWIDGRNHLIDDVLSIIASLQQEQPEVDIEKLTEEKYPYPCPMWYLGDDEGYEREKENVNRLRRAFKYGYNARKEKEYES